MKPPRPSPVRALEAALTPTVFRRTVQHGRFHLPASNLQRLFCSFSLVLRLTTGAFHKKPQVILQTMLRPSEMRLVERSCINPNNITTCPGDTWGPQVLNLGIGAANCADDLASLVDSATGSRFLNSLHVVNKCSDGFVPTCPWTLGRPSRLRHAAGNWRRSSGVCKQIAEEGRISFNVGGASEREGQENGAEQRRP